MTTRPKDMTEAQLLNALGNTPTAYGSEYTYELLRRIIGRHNALDTSAMSYVSEHDNPEIVTHLRAEIDHLAQFIRAKVPGEPSQDQGAIDTAIRVMRDLLTKNDTADVDKNRLRNKVDSLERALKTARTHNVDLKAENVGLEVKLENLRNVAYGRKEAEDSAAIKASTGAGPAAYSKEPDPEHRLEDDGGPAIVETRKEVPGGLFVVIL